MVLGYSLLRAYVAEHIQLLLVFSTHSFFLSGCAVETREFCGTASASNRVFPQPVRERILRIGSRIKIFGFVATVLILTFQNFSQAQNASPVNSPPVAMPFRNPLVPPFLAPIYSEVVPISSGFAYNPAYDNLETFVAPNGRTVKVLVKGPEGGGTYTRAINSEETADAYFP